MPSIHSRRASRARRRAFIAVPDLLGAAVVGGFLAYVGAQSFFLGDAIGARAASESAARELSARSAGSSCSNVEPGSPADAARFAPQVTLDVGVSPPNVAAVLAVVQGLAPEAGAKPLVVALFDSPMLVAQLDVATSLSRSHTANMFGRPGGTFVGRAHRGVPCLQAKLPDDADLARRLSREFYKQLPFGGSL